MVQYFRVGCTIFGISKSRSMLVTSGGFCLSENQFNSLSTRKRINIINRMIFFCGNAITKTSFAFCLITDDFTGYLITVSVPAGRVAIFNARFLDESPKLIFIPQILFERVHKFFIIHIVGSKGFIGIKFTKIPFSFSIFFDTQKIECKFFFYRKFIPYASV